MRRTGVGVMATKSDDLLKGWADQKTTFIATRGRLLETVVGQNGGNYDAICGGRVDRSVAGAKTDDHVSHYGY